jgi:formylglycine-generating enzyme required for sulfatase activity
MTADCAWCPAMVALPAGRFLMGSPNDEAGRLAVEGPQHLITIEKPFAIGKFAVTVDQFGAFVAETAHAVGATCGQWNGVKWQDEPGSFRKPGFRQAGDHPAVCVSWEDAQSYVGWLSSKTAQQFRLLTEAEWEYAARAGTETPYWWGTSISAHQANYNAGASNNLDGNNHPWRQKTTPASGFEPNPWGLYQMHGNVWEWVEDRWRCDYGGDITHREIPTVCKRVLRGGSWKNGPRGLRSARRHAAEPGFRRSDVGFRIARTLEVCAPRIGTPHAVRQCSSGSKRRGIWKM